MADQSVSIEMKATTAAAVAEVDKLSGKLFTASAVPAVYEHVRDGASVVSGDICGLTLVVPGVDAGLPVLECDVDALRDEVDHDPEQRPGLRQAT